MLTLLQLKKMYSVLQMYLNQKHISFSIYLDILCKCILQFLVNSGLKLNRKPIAYSVSVTFHYTFLSAVSV